MNDETRRYPRRIRCNDKDLELRGALLRDYVCDTDGVTHDLVTLSLEVARHRTQMEAYGYNEAF
jgi:hypothetical protein